MALESPVEVLKMRFVKGEITHEQFKEMLSVLVPPSASSTGAHTPPAPPAAQAPPPSYKDMVYIPPVSEPSSPPAPSNTGLAYILGWDSPPDRRWIVAGPVLFILAWFFIPTRNATIELIAYCAMGLALGMTARAIWAEMNPKP